MLFELSAFIRRSPADVFRFFKDIDKHPRDRRSIVPVLEKTTPGPTQVGSQYREIVRLRPGLTMQINSVLTACQQASFLAYEWTGPWMEGELEYTFTPENGGTRLTQKQTIQPQGLLRLFTPLMRWSFRIQVGRRLESIKNFLDAQEERYESSSNSESVARS